MTGFSQKYTIICLLEDRVTGSTYDYTAWPLHITIADTFAIDWQVGQILNALKSIAAKTKKFTAKAAHDEYFGANHDIGVTIITPDEQLTRLHYDIVKALKPGGLIFNDPQYNEAGYRAHAKIQPHARINEGDSVDISKIALIDMFPEKDPYKRKVLGVFELVK